MGELWESIKPNKTNPQTHKSTPPVSVKKTSGVLFVAKWRFENQTRKNVFHNQEGAVILISNLPQLNLRHKLDRKSTRLNSSHVAISYAVFCLKKKKKTAGY